jgi:hypothetical protein
MKINAVFFGTPVRFGGSLNTYITTRLHGVQMTLSGGLLYISKGEDKIIVGLPNISSMIPDDLEVTHETETSGSTSKRPTTSKKVSSI